MATARVKITQLIIFLSLLTVIYCLTTMPSVVLRCKVINETDSKIKCFIIDISSDNMIVTSIDAKNSQHVRIAQGDDSRELAKRKFLIMAVDGFGAILYQKEYWGDDLLKDNAVNISMTR